MRQKRSVVVHHEHLVDDRPGKEQVDDYDQEGHQQRQ
jgi:hypothetical protein